jgi:hypothetical protein
LAPVDNPAFKLVEVDNAPCGERVDCAPTVWLEVENVKIGAFGGVKAAVAPDEVTEEDACAGFGK